MKRFISLLLALTLMLGLSVTAMAAGSSKNINVNTDVVDNLSNSTEKDQFFFSLSHNGSAYLSFNYNYEGGYSVNLYHSVDGEWDRIQHNYFAYGGSYATSTITKSGDRVRLGAGDYRITVERSSSTSTSNYTLRVNFVDEYGGPYEVAPNDQAYQATPFAPNTTIYGNMDASEDVDYFKFTLNEYGLVNISLNYDYEGGYRVTLYYADSSNLEKYASYYFAYGGTHSAPTVERSMDPMRLWPGDYYVKVEKSSSLTNSDYGLTVRYTEEASVSYEREINDDGPNANLIDTNRPVTGNLHSSEDADFYQVNIFQLDDLSVQLNYDAAGKYRVTLYGLTDSGALNKIETFYFNGKSSSTGYITETSKAVSCVPVTYYIAVQYSNGGMTTKDYTLTVKANKSTSNYPAIWAEKDVDDAIDKELVPDYIQYNYADNISRAEFCTLAVTLLCIEKGTGIDSILAAKGVSIDYEAFTDTTDYNILAANALGIVNGKNNNRFDPYGAITRQEAAAMLTRTAKVLGITSTNTSPMSFTDAGSIATWAKDSVDFVSAVLDPISGNRIMGGVSGNRFAPQGYYTREQSIITILRLFRAA